MQRRFPHGVASRGIFCSRTLSLRSITTIGYDMDYTLIHYNVQVSNSRGGVPPTFPSVLFCSPCLARCGVYFSADSCMITAQAWEGRAYEYGMNNLRSMGYPVDGLKFDPELVSIWIR